VSLSKPQESEPWNPELIQLLSLVAPVTVRNLYLSRVYCFRLLIVSPIRSMSRFRGVCAWHKTGFLIGFIDTLHTQLGTTGNTALSLINTLSGSPLHTHYNSQSSLVVSWQRIYKSHCHFKSHMKSSFHRLIPFLPLFCNCHFRRLDSIQLLCSQAHIPAGWRLETRLTLLSNHFAQTTQKTQPLSFVGKASLQRRRIATIVTRLLLGIRCPGGVYRVVA
jgi:hypothetical protein